MAADLGDPAAVEGLVATVTGLVGHLDVLVCNHAHGGDAVDLAHLTVAALDRHWAVNTRATLLLTQAFAAQHDGRPGGRVIWMTSGQSLGPMSDNLAYAVSKAALAGATVVCRGRPGRPGHPAEHRQPRSGEHRLPRRRAALLRGRVPAAPDR